MLYWSASTSTPPETARNGSMRDMTDYRRLGYSEAIHAMAYGKALSAAYLQQTKLRTLTSKDITLSLLPLQD
jgi:hypothetical protein